MEKYLAWLWKKAKESFSESKAYAEVGDDGNANFFLGRETAFREAAQKLQELKDKESGSL